MLVGVDLSEIRQATERIMSRPVKSISLDIKEIAGKIIYVFFFSCEYEEIGTQFRWQMFIDGKMDAGGII
jgi:hypothetical protein